MRICANVGASQNAFVATLSNGQHMKVSSLPALANALVGSGVQADALGYEWKSGQRMMTAGQQVALEAEMRKLLNKQHGMAIAA